MNQSSFFSGTGYSTAIGTLLSIIPGIKLGDVLQTVILGAIGASVSFLVTLAWKQLLRNTKR
ncbi:MAG: hypothetical protein HZA79_17025 [Sphingobacteriales bacterium]|nr:hypothetical protein [Sphingobacteriales bacterium]